MFKIVVQHFVFAIHGFVEEETVEFAVHAVAFLSFVEGVGQFAFAGVGLTGEFYLFQDEVAERDLYRANVVAVAAEHGISDDMFGVGVVV